MSNITENPIWEANVDQIDTTDTVSGGPSGAVNIQAQQLANRTRYLYDRLTNAGLQGSAARFSGDLDTLITPGFYAIEAGATNKPATSYGHLLVNGDSNFVGGIVIAVQLYFSQNAARNVYVRYRQGAGYTAWRKVLTDADQDSLTPTGMVATFAGPNPPSGWFKAAGQAVSRTIYANLFAQVGTTYGPGDGATTFNLPDLRGEFVRGWVDGRTGVDDGRTLGSFQADVVGAHGHQVQNVEYSNAVKVVEGGALDPEAVANVSALATNDTVTDPTGETRPRNVALLMCIKY